MYQTLDFPFMLFYVEGNLLRDVKEPYYDMLLLGNYIKTIEYSIKPFVFTKSKILFADIYIHYILLGVFFRSQF